MKKRIRSPGRPEPLYEQKKEVTGLPTVYFRGQGGLLDVAIHPNFSENKIILIYNHGQKSHDGPSSDCAWKSGMQNISSLVGKKINDKEIKKR